MDGIEGSHDSVRTRWDGPEKIREMYHLIYIYKKLQLLVKIIDLLKVNLYYVIRKTYTDLIEMNIKQFQKM